MLYHGSDWSKLSECSRRVRVIRQSSPDGHPWCPGLGTSGGGFDRVPGITLQKGRGVQCPLIVRVGNSSLCARGKKSVHCLPKNTDFLDGNLLRVPLPM